MSFSKDEAIAGLDLEPIKHKLMQDKPGAGWSRGRAEAAEREYRRYLYLMKTFPDAVAAPSLDVDRFWRHHIVDTTKYARDCEAVFGYFLHHYPYLGMGGAEDAAARVQAGARMRELYRQVFGAGHEEPDSAQQARTGFSVAVQSNQQAESRAPQPCWPGFGETDEPGPAGDLLDQLRLVVIENQRWDRVAEPVM